MTTDVLDDDARQINEALQRAWDDRREIDDGLARRIARRLSHDWPVSLFAATGAISRELKMVLAALAEDDREPHGIWIAALGQYCEHHGRRGPVADWDKEPER